MNREALVNYRISRAWETYEEAKLLASRNHWNATANRLYYSCCYMVQGILILKNYQVKSHNGAKAHFHQYFVKEGIVSKDIGKLYNRLFNLRQEGDYIDFKRFGEEDISPFIDDVYFFLTKIETLINEILNKKE